jgi:tyrosyl-tRNA synthetase
MSLELTDAPVLEPGDRSPEIPPMSDPAFKSGFLRTMQARGFIHQISHPVELDAACRGRAGDRLHRVSTRRRPACTWAA